MAERNDNRGGIRTCSWQVGFVECGIHGGGCITAPDVVHSPLFDVYFDQRGILAALKVQLLP